MRVLLILIFGSLCTLIATAQDDTKLIWRPKDVTLEILQAEFDLMKPDSLEPNIWLRMLMDDMHGEGYLEASIDSLHSVRDSTYIHIHRGPRYSSAHIDWSQIPTGFESIARRKMPSGTVFNHQEIKELFESILIRAENNGYPFASIRLDSLSLRDSLIHASVNLNLNNRITMEPHRIEGDLQITQQYMEQILDLRAGELFDRQKILDSRTRLDELSFIKTFRNPTVSFLGDGATLNLYLNKKPANQFDILLGLIPSNRENQRFRLTGNVNILMENQFGVGERFHMNFESLQPATQELELDFSYPFVLGLPFGTELHFDLYKRDSTYIDLNYEVGIRYFVGRRSSLKFYIDNSQSNLLNIDTTIVLQTRTLPSSLDLSRSLFGIQYRHDKLDYRLNPRKGREIMLSISAGRKRIRKSDVITQLVDDSDPDFNFGDLYNELDLNQFQLKLQGSFKFYLPLFQSSAILLRQRTGLISSDNILYDNELFRIGGTKLLRGFNEESIRASFFTVSTLEYRLLFGQNSNLFVFTDIGYFQQKSQGNKLSDSPVGLGVGMNLETKIGVFGISYAIGKQESDSFDFRTGKIHFGMVSLF